MVWTVSTISEGVGVSVSAVSIFVIVSVSAVSIFAGGELCWIREGASVSVSVSVVVNLEVSVVVNLVKLGVSIFAGELCCKYFCNGKGTG